MLAIFGAIRGAVKTSWRRFGDSSSNDDRMHLPVSPESSHIQVAPVQPVSAGSPIIGAHLYVGPHIERPLSLSLPLSKTSQPVGSFVNKKLAFPLQLSRTFQSIRFLARCVEL